MAGPELCTRKLLHILVDYLVQLQNPSKQMYSLEWHTFGMLQKNMYYETRTR